MSLKKRALGGSGLTVAPLCFGGNVLGWTVDESTAFSILDAFVAAGFDFIDTADVYSRWAPGHQGGESETLLGRWFARGAAREKVILATKVGMDMGEGRKGLSARWIEQAVEDSLRRLKTDYIDLYQSHQDDPDTPQQETLLAYDRLIRAGKVRAIGASNFSAARLTSALELARSAGLPLYASLQPLYNLYDREPFEAELAALCVAQGIGVINYYALAAGFLSGKYRRAEDARESVRGEAVIRKYLNERGLRILAALDEVAAACAATPSSVAIAWLLTRPAVTAPIASATNLGQLGELLAGAQLTLPPWALTRLEAASAWTGQ
jgi:aryl-alcohol dehydrogenase-like predicted oxidoreductase